jgi:CO/xanthine dehydrogenase FAD-binding subunit
VGVAVTRRASEWRVVANSVAPTVCRCRSVETLLADGHPVSGPADLAPALGEDVSPIDDIRSTARYRGEVLARLLYWGLRDECPSFT